MEPRGLPDQSSERPWGCLGIHGGTLGVLGCSWGVLGRALGASWGSLGSPCRGLVPHMVGTPMFELVLCFVALASFLSRLLSMFLSFRLFCFFHMSIKSTTPQVVYATCFSTFRGVLTRRELLQGSPWETPWPTWRLESPHVMNTDVSAFLVVLC